jgi:group I intron endonuclease
MEFYIYTLSHPETNEVRYVGKTINIKRRYKQHLYDKRTTHKSSWVKSLKQLGLKPIMTIIETCNETNWIDREKFWITQFDNLTNLLDGGGVHYTRTTKEETKAKISAIHKGKILTEDHKEKIRKSSMKSAKKTLCIIDNVEYESIKDASRKLNILHNTIQVRLKSKKFPNYVRL